MAPVSFERIGRCSEVSRGVLDQGTGHKGHVIRESNSGGSQLGRGELDTRQETSGGVKQVKEVLDFDVSVADEATKKSGLESMMVGNCQWKS